MSGIALHGLAAKNTLKLQILGHKNLDLLPIFKLSQSAEKFSSEFSISSKSIVGLVGGVGQKHEVALHRLCSDL